MVKIIVEDGDMTSILGNINIEKWEVVIDEFKDKIANCEMLLEMFSPDAPDFDKEICEEKGWDDKTRICIENNLKANKIMLAFKKLNLLLFKCVLDNKDLSKLLPLLKIKYEDNFSASLELLQDQVDTSYIDEGEYLEIANDMKLRYDETFEKIKIFEKIADGCEFDIEDE